MPENEVQFQRGMGLDDVLSMDTIYRSAPGGNLYGVTEPCGRVLKIDEPGGWIDRSINRTWTSARRGWMISIR